MTAAELVQQRIFEIWNNFQAELKRVIAPLTVEQLNLRLVPQQRSLGEIAAHIVFGRAKWTLKVLEVPDPGLQRLLAWEEPGDPPPTAAELVQGLDLTWRWYTTLIDRWSSYPPGTALPENEVEGLETIWGMLDHEFHHGGELSFCLGAFSLDTPDM